MNALQYAAYATPGGFGKFFLKLPLTDKQVAVLNSFMDTGSHVSGVFCNEAGKTTKLIATLVLWHCFTHQRRGENGGVIATSSTKYAFWPSCASDPMSGFSYRMLETFT